MGGGIGVQSCILHLSHEWEDALVFNLATYILSILYFRSCILYLASEIFFTFLLEMNERKGGHALEYNLTWRVIKMAIIGGA